MLKTTQYFESILHNFLVVSYDFTNLENDILGVNMQLVPFYASLQNDTLNMTRTLYLVLILFLR